MANIYFTLLLVSSALALSSAADWNYIRGDPNGPAAWGKKYAACNGSSNSPIDIVTNDAVKQVVEENWDLSGWDMETNWTVSDTGYTIKFSLEDGQTVATGLGHLGAVYNLVQFHFHWGNNSTRGSEHQIDGESYPMVVHFVHYKNTYADLGTALASGESDALAALGIFFEIDDNNNTDLMKIVDGVTEVRKNSSVSVTGYMLDALTSVFEDALLSNYYRYNGGLTTPSCDETVKWTVFERPIKVSESQMEVFRALNSEDYGTEVYRDPQPVNDRTINYYDDSYTTTKKTQHSTVSSAAIHTAFWSALLISVAAKLF